MASMLSTISSNPHIAALETALAETPRPVEWLVIAHHDSRMLSALRSALAGEAAVFLEVSQDTWDFEGGQLRETVEWALEQTQIRHLMLVGHSQSGGPRSRVSLAAAESRDVTQGGYGRLVAGVQENNARHRAAQDRLAIHVRQMSDIPLVRDRYSDGELALYSLIYRAENGIFLAYDRQEDQFHPLVG